MGVTAEFDESAVLAIRFLTWNVVCRWMPGGGLAGIICSCHAPGLCEHRVAAVLAYQSAHGLRQIRAESTVLEASVGAPRTREEILESVGVVLREMVGLGLARLSRSTEDRLRTLAVSAHGVDLPRLERSLRSLADEVGLALSRDAQAASSNLLATAARIEALRSALICPTRDFVGVHRSRYEKVGDIELVGLGARQWRTRSGYQGLTVYFWDRSAKQWATWTDSRPVTVPDFSPLGRYQQDGPWSGCPSPVQACRNVIRLMSGWRNYAGRLSGRPGTRCLILESTDSSQIPGIVTSWTELADRAARLFGGGLKERSEQHEVVLLQPATWGPGQFDSIRQEFVQPILDRAGRPLMLIVPHTPQTENAIAILEQQDPTQTRCLLGILRLERETLAVDPIALHQEKNIINLTLDGLPSTKPVASTAGDVEEEAQEAEEPEEMAASSSALGLLLVRIAEQFESAAEGGLRSARNMDVLRGFAAQANALGLTICAKLVARLASQLDQLRKSVEPDTGHAATTLLRGYYVLRFAAAQEILSSATALLK
jgi:hypothetical protein